MCEQKKPLESKNPENYDFAHVRYHYLDFFSMKHLLYDLEFKLFSEFQRKNLSELN